MFPKKAIILQKYLLIFAWKLHYHLQEQLPLSSEFLNAFTDDFTTTLPCLENKNPVQCPEESNFEETLLLHSLITQAASSTYTLPISSRQEALISKEIFGITGITDQQQHSKSPTIDQQIRKSIFVDEDLEKYQCWLQKTIDEKRELETELAHTRAELIAVCDLFFFKLMHNCYFRNKECMPKQGGNYN